jgi:hypothetical protein
MCGPFSTRTAGAKPWPGLVKSSRGLGLRHFLSTRGRCGRRSCPMRERGAHQDHGRTGKCQTRTRPRPAWMTATVTATAAANGYPQRPATAHNARTIRTNLGYVRPEKQTVGSSPGGPRTLEGRNPQFRNPICARICARDAAGQTEIGETRKTRNNLVAHACRGQRDDERLFETQETRVVWLITQRSGFKSRPRYQGQRPFLEQRKGLLLASC